MAKGVYIGVQATVRRLGDIAVGSVVKVNENGSPVNYIIVHQGNPSTSKYDSSCNGTWLLREKIAENRVYGPNYDDSIYYRSEIYTYLKDTYPTRYDSSVQSLIKTAKVPYFGYGIGATELTGANGLEVKAFLLSAKEIGAGYGTWAGIVKNSDEGVTLSYFISGTSAAACDLRKAYNAAGIAYASWFTRTYYSSEDTDKVCGVSITGTVGDMTCNSSNGIRPAIIVDSNAAINDDNLLTGSTYTSSTVSVARKVNKMYIGVGGVARKIKKAYIGVGGVARPFWSGGELAYYGTVAIDQPSLVYGTTLGNYAIFAGNYYTSSSSYTRITYAFDKNLTKTLPTALSISKSYQINGATAGSSYAVYASSNTASINAYNTDLTLTTGTALGKKLTSFAAGSIGSYALFAGGMDDESDAVTNVYAYNENLTRSNATALERAHYNMRSANVGNYVLFGTGTMQSSSVGKSNRIYAYDSALSRTTVTTSDTQRDNVGSGSIGNQYALFVGGCPPDGDSNLSEVAVYDSSLVKTSGTNLNVARDTISSASLGDYIIFAGGIVQSGSSTSNDTYSSAVESYNLDLTRKTENNLSVARRGRIGAASIGSYALFVGGQTASSTYKSEKIADVFTIA